jgi:hypothetical protein
MAVERSRPVSSSLRLIIAASIIATMPVFLSMGQEISVRAAVSSQRVFYGEEIVYQIQIEGSDSPEKPDTSTIADFSVSYESGRANNSHSISIVNGRRRESVRLGYLMNYRMVPKRAGTFTIPPLTITIDGVDFRTPQISIRVDTPAETEDYKLRLLLSKDATYLGEPVTLTVVWYWNPEKPVKTLTSFSVPVLASSDFRIAETGTDPPTGVQLMQLPVQGENTIVIQRERMLNGKRYTTLEFERILIPRKTGTYQIPAATVVFDGVTGYEQYRDFFGRNSRREITGKFVVPSNAPSLSVSELPVTGRPDNFSGLVGEYFIDVSASHTSVNVGDPITLTIRVSGSGYLGEFVLPALSDISNIARDFKIPDERASGRTEDDERVFTQTIRAKHPGVESIPSIQLFYFNPRSESYVASISDPIPIEVKETRIVTIQDVEGEDPIDVGTDIETFTEGIAHNYEDLDVLVNRSLGIAAIYAYPSRIMLLFVAPALFFGVLLYMRIGRNRSMSASDREIQRAHHTFIRDVNALDIDADSAVTSKLLELLSRYIRVRLKISSGALTYNDIASDLASRGTDSETLAKLREVFDECEAGHYGGIGSESLDSLRFRAIAVAKDIEAVLR